MINLIDDCTAAAHDDCDDEREEHDDDNDVYVDYVLVWSALL